MTPTLITKTLRDAVSFIGADLGFLPSEVSVRSLRVAGATALLIAKVDPDVIRLLGRWRSDKMLRHLHLTSEPSCTISREKCFEQSTRSSLTSSCLCINPPTPSLFMAYGEPWPTVAQDSKAM